MNIPLIIEIGIVFGAGLAVGLYLGYQVGKGR